MEKTFILITFSSTHSAMAMERLLKKHFKIVMMPVLREISSSCGMAIKMDMEFYEKALEIINESNLEQDRYTIYKIIDKGASKEIITL
ncbi:MAG: DUF3343 domain-containing protein [Cellulosilyticaceae bacterium]